MPQDRVEKVQGDGFYPGFPLLFFGIACRIKEQDKGRSQQAPVTEGGKERQSGREYISPSRIFHLIPDADQQKAGQKVEHHIEPLKGDNLLGPRKSHAEGQLG